MSPSVVNLPRPTALYLLGLALIGAASSARAEDSDKPGWIGVNIQPVDDATVSALGLPRKMGAKVTQVSIGGPAEAAGIKVGDVLIGMAGATIKDPQALVEGVKEGAGLDVIVRIRGRDKDRLVPLTIGTRLDSSR